MSLPFELLDPSDAASVDDRRDQIDRRPSPGERSLEATAHLYQPSPDLVDAVNVSLALSAPLLLTGEPGTGKTQVAYYLKQHFGVELFSLHVRSSTTAEDLFYHFDAVAYLYAAHDPARKGQNFAEVKRDLVHRGKGALWKAFESTSTSIVLIDEIDKAPRDFPNDLLNAVDQLYFRVPETDETIRCKKAPITVITSNSERRLPEPFLRRCVVHHIELTEKLVRTAVQAHLDGGRFPRLDADVRDVAIRRFMEMRTLKMRKPPATAELLAWLTVLSARGDITAAHLDGCRLNEMPALITLIKDRDDRVQL